MCDRLLSPTLQGPNNYISMSSRDDEVAVQQNRETNAAIMSSSESPWNETLTRLGNASKLSYFLCLINIEHRSQGPKTSVWDV